MELARVRVASAPARAAWAVGQEVALPGALLGPDGLGPHLRGQTLALPDDFRLLAGHEDLRDLAAYTDQKPLSSRMAFSYQRVPAALRSLIASCMGRVQRRRHRRWARFPAWPLDLSADFLADLAGADPAGAGHRPHGPTPVLLTHDLDSHEGLANLAALFLDREERVGAHSYSYTVPCKYALDHGLLAEVAARGHGIGMHGYDHSNLTAFVAPQERTARLEQGLKALAPYAPRGFRAPSLLRSRGLLREVARLFAHDSSIPTSGGLFPIPNNGCASARPFQAEGVLEIPLSMPRDGSMRFLGYSPREIAGVWKTCAERIADSGGVVVVLTHCERRFSGHPRYLAAYVDFLEYLAASPRFAFSTPDELAADWAGNRRG